MGAPLSRFFRPTRPYSIVFALAAIGLPERPRNLILDLGAAEADVAQQPVVELAQMTALTGVIEPGENLIEEARDETAIGLGPRGTHEVGARFVICIVPIQLTFSSIRNVRLSQLPPWWRILLLTLCAVNANIVLMTIWIPDLTSHRGPRYLAIADALATDIRSSRLSPGDRLPTHRLDGIPPDLGHAG